MKRNKYIYWKVIQQNYGRGWEDVAMYETDSNGNFKTKKDEKIFKHDLKEYKILNRKTRTIFRKEKN